MAQSLDPVELPKNTWVDLYAETGITVGLVLIAQNTGKDEALLVESAASPAPGYGFNRIPVDEFLTNVAGNVGAWAFSSRGTTLQVEVSV